MTGTFDGSLADNQVTAGIVDLDGFDRLHLSLRRSYLPGGGDHDGSDDLVATPMGGTLDDMTLDGTLDMTQFSDATARVIDSLTLDGTIDLGGAAGTTNNATLYVGNGSSDTNPETIGGSGVLQFGQDNSGDTLENVAVRR